MTKWYSFEKLKSQDKRKELLNDTPDFKPLNLKTGALIFGGVCAFGLGIGAVAGTYIFFGCVTLAGLIAVAESNKYVKAIIVKGNKTIDILILGASIVASFQAGPTIGIATTVAGLGFTTVYIPYIRYKFDKDKKMKYGKTTTL